MSLSKCLDLLGLHILELLLHLLKSNWVDIDCLISYLISLFILHLFLLVLICLKLRLGSGFRCKRLCLALNVHLLLNILFDGCLFHFFLLLFFSQKLLLQFLELSKHSLFIEFAHLFLFEPLHFLSFLLQFNLLHQLSLIIIVRLKTVSLVATCEWVRMRRLADGICDFCILTREPDILLVIRVRIGFLWA